MHSILKLSSFLLCLSLLTSCTKKQDEVLITEVKSGQEVNVQMKNNDNYELNLLISGDEEGARIITQATHFQKSELERGKNTNWEVVYKYTPLPSYIGSDFVEIETCTGGSSTGCDNKNILRINFTITN